MPALPIHKLLLKAAYFWGFNHFFFACSTSNRFTALPGNDATDAGGNTHQVLADGPAAVSVQVDRDAAGDQHLRVDHLHHGDRAGPVPGKGVNNFSI